MFVAAAPYQTADCPAACCLSFNRPAGIGEGLPSPVPLDVNRLRSASEKAYPGMFVMSHITTRTGSLLLSSPYFAFHFGLCSLQSSSNVTYLDQLSRVLRPVVYLLLERCRECVVAAPR